MNNENGSYPVAAWRVIEKRKGIVYLFFDLIITGLGVFIIAILIFLILNENFEILELLFLSAIGIILLFIGCIPIFFQKRSPNSPLTEGFLRFNSEFVEFIDKDENLVLRIPLDEQVNIHPLVCSSFTNELCGVIINRGKHTLEIETNLGYSLRDIQNEIPFLIYFAKRKNVNLSKSWKLVKYFDSEKREIRHF